ncbi:hypothetical protein J6590_012775 [Homalodisca vitripennis]|nr:hypothetical protein J6590_012775 [Homalodisca vitripennis]
MLWAPPRKETFNCILAEGGGRTQVYTHHPSVVCKQRTSQEAGHFGVSFTSKGRPIELDLRYPSSGSPQSRQRIRRLNATEEGALAPASSIPLGAELWIGWSKCPNDLQYKGVELQKVAILEIRNGEKRRRTPIIRDPGQYETKAGISLMLVCATHVVYSIDTYNNILLSVRAPPFKFKSRNVRILVNTRGRGDGKRISDLAQAETTLRDNVDFFGNQTLLSVDCGEDEGNTKCVLVRINR